MGVRPRILDLFCGAGGCSVGYARVGFDVFGVDHLPQPRYPFEQHIGDALEYLAEFGTDDFDAISASPPCQDYSRALRHLASPQPRLIEPVRRALEAAGLPWVIENVEGAPMPRQDTLDGRYGVELCGTMFGLRVYRHRLFETSFPVSAPRPCGHSVPAMNPHNAKGRAAIGYAPETQWRNEMGVEWMNKAETREAVPPSYTEHIGSYLLAHLNASTESAA